VIGDFLVRLVVALPVILLLAVGSLLLWRRVGARMPEMGLPLVARPGAWMAAASGGEGERLDLVSAQSLLPGVRVAVLRYGGQAYLVGAGPHGVTLLATPGQVVPPAAPIGELLP
jgi:hypothetical protein